MGFRITTWNVNGIRNPFGYQPWRDRRTFEAMFEILEADIVVFQETKIQRKDLRDDMVLVPGWDNYWSLPKHKKGYSGVVIYTRNATCSPIRAEEGVTGILTPPNTTTSFRDLPDHQQIGGYPTLDQLQHSDYDPVSLDAEGRCVILEFPAFVLIGTYCPAERDETRTHFRTSFLRLLDARIRNLVKLGKRVVWTGDLNISREEIDTAAVEENMRKANVDPVEWISHPARRTFNQLLVGGKVHGERDEGRETPIMWDLCRGFHEGRRGMYTCWETKVNARPGNYGSRIDYVLCSRDMKDWFCDANIQEGLMGSDHCPVYAVLKDEVPRMVTAGLDGSTHILDVVNPQGMFVKGIRRQEWSTKCLLPMSGKLIQEFDKRRSIRDMFTQKPGHPKSTIGAAATAAVEEDAMPSSTTTAAVAHQQKDQVRGHLDVAPLSRTISDMSASATTKTIDGKRPAKAMDDTPSTVKRTKTTSQTILNSSTGGGKAQQSLRGFFSAKPPPPRIRAADCKHDSAPVPAYSTSTAPTPHLMANDDYSPTESASRTETDTLTTITSNSVKKSEAATSFAAKETWGKLFSKLVAPHCEHGEPCKTMITKKPGINCGRSFWMCNRPLGPSGKQERATEWRCNTFIWASDWDSRSTATDVGSQG